MRKNSLDELPLWEWPLLKYQSEELSFLMEEVEKEEMRNHIDDLQISMIGTDISNS